MEVFHLQALDTSSGTLISYLWPFTKCPLAIHVGKGIELLIVLARMAYNFSPFQVWMEDVSSNLASVYFFDLPE